MLKPKASLIIAFYNNTVCLELIFKALSIQTESNFEVIIADDGSKQEAIDFIYTHRESLPFSVKHVWHEDKGFRKNRILNHAVIKSSSNYLIIIDGDCIPEKHFIEDHLSQAEKGRSLSGRRVELPEQYTQRVIDSSSPGTFFNENKLEITIRYIFSNGDKQTKGRHIEKGFRFAKPWQQLLLKGKTSKAILGCNFSLFKEDLLKINGFDMRYEAPAVGEDSDVDYRLNLIGVTNKSLNGLAVQIHLYHTWLDRVSENKDIFRDTIKHERYWAENGIESLSVS
ncbi:glycosyltransferase [Aliivibrio wodanis]|uniref:glycosyltransferase n=1 Tax=Aliivibrio wodanis TaxID=80852 RepID=UPI00406C49E9